MTLKMQPTKSQSAPIVSHVHPAASYWKNVVPVIAQKSSVITRGIVKPRALWKNMTTLK
jgi:hypothetical protein